MKKQIYILMTLALAIFYGTQAQNTFYRKLTNSEVKQIIDSSKEINRVKAGVINPDLIQSGQMLRFLFKDGMELSLMVKSKDNQSKMLKDNLSVYTTYGSTQDTQNESQRIETSTQSAQNDSKTCSVFTVENSGFGMFFILVGVVTFISYMKYKK